MQAQTQAWQQYEDAPAHPMLPSKAHHRCMFGIGLLAVRLTPQALECHRGTFPAEPSQLAVAISGTARPMLFAAALLALGWVITRPLRYVALHVTT